jgi:hypothetical protein
MTSPICTPGCSGDGTRWCGCAFNPEPLRPTCNGQGRFDSIVFASLGTPGGSCGAFQLGDCFAPAEVVHAAVAERCMGRTSCFIPTTVEDLADGEDPCLLIPKYTAVEMTCEPFTAAEIFVREWGALTVIAGLAAGFALYVTLGACLCPRRKEDTVPGFGYFGAHPCGHPSMLLIL